MKSVVTAVDLLTKLGSLKGSYSDFTGKRCTLIPLGQNIVTELVMNKKESEFFFSSTFVTKKQHKKVLHSGTYSISYAKFKKFIRANSIEYKEFNDNL